MTGSIFLSAGVPDPRRSAEFARTARPVAISSAVAGLIHVALGRRVIVWGGQPAITPMVWVVAEAMGMEYGRWVHLYQSRFFQDDFPDDNKRYQNVTYTAAVDGNKDASLLAMRRQMLSENSFDAAVFIGGMDGIIDEFRLFRELQPHAKVIPIVSAGGATATLESPEGRWPEDLSTDLDYIALFHRQLGVDVTEERTNGPLVK
ncbi:hypothetical protein [Dyella sp. 333MFSha]|uniref:SLOG domain-containing protein n=1 Tax=Dyella sp. 333MFSha TaxID=1798240 RepID=UPI0008905008|nr:hypothetical protein [Dyella sp. 333MFSha]SDF39553.1 hypothetical protein SAMN04515659_0849 [Dyella sp. 333MFSha]